MTVQLQIPEKSDKEILKLPRAVKGAIYDFQHRFRQNPFSPGLRLKPLRGDSRLFSARVTDDYRALLLKAGDDKWLLIAVQPRGCAYDDLSHYAHLVSPVSGGIEVIDIMHASQAVEIAGAVKSVPVPDSTAPGGEPAAPLFAAYSDGQLLKLGVAEPLLPVIAKLTTEEELLGLAEYAPQLTSEVLLALHDGRSAEEVWEQVTAPARPAEPVDIADYETALDRPATVVTTDDAALRAALEGDFTRWQVFLHPAQRQIVRRSYNGPARVGGGPGTGKTIVALHRVRYLARHLPSRDGASARDSKEILVTTFNKNLARDLQDRLTALAGREILDRVEIINVDALASRIVARAEPGTRRHWMDDSRARDIWESVLLEVGEDRWDAGFLHDEWSQVVLGQALTSRDEYFRARRTGRGKSLNRMQRAAVWQLIERFTKVVTERKLMTFRQVAARAAIIARADAADGRYRYRYRHVVVDEAQDLSAAHWLLLRALVPPGPNDMFLAGDTHQRIYDNYVSLGSIGISIRGRSSRLTLSYRNTHQILSAAENLLGGGEWDDLDDGADSLSGYRSLLRGPKPEFQGYSTWKEEQDGIVERLRAWSEPLSAGVAVPDRDTVTETEKYLRKAGIDVTVIGKDGPQRPDAAVYVGTLHRFKGLEFEKMIVAGAADGLIPATRIAPLKVTDPVRYEREVRQARSLLFVAATRARDELVITWHGTPSPFLPEVPRS